MVEQIKPIRIVELRAADGAGGGPEKTIFNGAKLSDPLGFDIRLIYLRNHRDECRLLEKRASDLQLSYSEVRCSGAFDRGVFRRLCNVLNDAQPLIIHSHDYKSTFLARWVARKYKIKLLATAHGWTGTRARERLLYYPAERFILRTFDRIISVSSQITSQLITSGVRSQIIATIPNGIDPRQFDADPTSRARERIQLGLAASQFVIGGVGRLEDQKRFDLLIDAFARIRNQYANCILLIAGDGTLKSQLQQQIDRLGLSASCRLIGHVDDVRRFYHALDLFVQSSEYEGTPNVVLEAMAMRVPVVATDAGGTRDIFSNRVDGLMVPSGNSEALATAIKETLSDPVEAGLRVIRARLRVETELSFLSRNTKLENIYRSMMNSESENSLL